MTKPTDPDEVATSYDEWSDSYDTSHNRTRDLDARALKAQGLSITGANVIELGCGTGKNTAWLAREAGSLLALDFSEGMLRQARSRVQSRSVRFVHHDLRRPWPASDASFDVAVADLVLEHIEELAPFFAEVARVLRRGGCFFSCELHPYRQLQGAQANFARGGHGEVQTVKAYRHEVAEYLNAGLRAGLQLVRVEEWKDDDAGPSVPARLFATLWRTD